jgi:hypothetical protein
MVDLDSHDLNALSEDGYKNIEPGVVQSRKINSSINKKFWEELIAYFP